MAARRVRIAGMLGCMAVLFAAAAPARAEIAYAPLTFRTANGIRPFVDVAMDGHRFRMMVHANARSTLMTTHANAIKAGIVKLVHTGSYGITKLGQVSTLGRDRATLPLLEVAGLRFVNLPVEVFEIPPDPPVGGMLGIDWMRHERVIVDYDHERLGIPSSLADSLAENRRLIAAGYVPHKLTLNPSDGTFAIAGSVNGHAVAMEISTVSNNIIDTQVAATAKIPLGPVIDDYGGPGASLGKVYIARRTVTFVVDGQRVAPDRPQIIDLYAYDSELRSPAPDPAHTVKLGADFMLANGAMVDFGTGMLFLEPAK